MPDYTAVEVERAVSTRDSWEGLFLGGLGLAAVIIGGEPVAVEVVDTASPDGDSEYENVWLVIRVGGQYFRKEGYYESHSGTTWSGTLREVTPRQKTVTVYE